jgi:hypothetical protein
MIILFLLFAFLNPAAPNPLFSYRVNLFCALRSHVLPEMRSFLIFPFGEKSIMGFQDPKLISLSQILEKGHRI